jgi:hypothetical protein
MIMISSTLKQELLSLSSFEELNEVMKFAQDALSLKNKVNINLGDEVYIVRKNGKTLGTVEKVNQKKAIIKIYDGQRYSVPFTMLEAA